MHEEHQTYCVITTQARSGINQFGILKDFKERLANLKAQASLK
jgi:hypothetical protein